MGVLTLSEKSVIKHAFPKKAFRIVCATKARLYTAATDPSSYEPSSVSGGLVLVEDLNSGKRYLKIVDLSQDQGILWSEEITPSLDYSRDRSFFHSFDLIYGHYAGLMFEDAHEANLFLKRITKGLENSSGYTPNDTKPHMRMRPTIPPLHPSQAEILTLTPSPPRPPPKDLNFTPSVLHQGQKMAPLQPHPSKFPPARQRTKPMALVAPYQVLRRQNLYERYHKQQTDAAYGMVPPPPAPPKSPDIGGPTWIRLSEWSLGGLPLFEKDGDLSSPGSSWNIPRDENSTWKPPREPVSPTSMENRRLRDSLMDTLANGSSLELVNARNAKN